jgi:hypothetical protein
VGKKGIINFIEAIFVIVAIFIAFAVLFPGFNFKNTWSDATIILTARDSILTMDRLNVLYQNSFNSNLLQNFIQNTLPANRTNLVAVSGVDGTVKDTITVVCNCSDQQIQNLTYWMSGMSINGRPANIIFFKTNLENINPVNVGGTNVIPDVLLIWGNTNLDSHLASLLNYLKTGGGIIEINDLTSISQTGTVQQQIFGLTYSGGKNFNDRAYADHFSRKPVNSNDIIYGPYKFFYHIPYPVKTYESVTSFLVEAGIPTPNCNSKIGHGNFTLNDTYYNFWICNPTTVYFDTNNNASADVSLNVGSNFKIMGYNFTLQYVNYPSQIGVSFRPDYQFSDFLIAWTSPGQACPQGNAWGQYYTDLLTTIDNNPARIIVNASFTKSQLLDLPVVIINNTGGRTAWIADFTNDPNIKNNCLTFSQASDDEKLLLASLIFWASNKQQSSNAQTGIMVPYVNVQNLDTYDVYVFNLGLRSAFGS